jgi:hypothetical protein
MKKILIGVAGLACIAALAFAAQDVVLDGQSEVRNPVRLEAWLESNAADAESRIASLEAGSTVGTVLPAYIIVGNASSQGVDVAVSGDVSLASDGAVTIAANAVEESMLKAVDAAADEDFLSYESTTGDFEWHSAAEVAGKFATVGTLTTNVIVDASYTNTIVLRTLASGVVVVSSWTQNAVN